MVALLNEQPAYWPAVLAPRLAVLFSRSRRPVELPTPATERRTARLYPDRGRRLAGQHAADRRALKQEEAPWRATGLSFHVRQA